MNEKLKAAIDVHLKSMFDIGLDLSDKQAEEILALRIQHHLHKIDEDEINEWLGISMRYNKEQEVAIVKDSEQKSMVKFKVGGKVRRNEKFAKPEIMPCYGMSKNTDYVIEHITPKGKLVLEDYMMVVDPDYVELVPEPIIGYYRTIYNISAESYLADSPIFLSLDEVPNTDGDNIEEIEIDRNSLINYIKHNKLI